MTGSGGGQGSTVALGPGSQKGATSGNGFTNPARMASTVADGLNGSSNDPLADLQAETERLASFGFSEQAQVAMTVLTRAREALRDWWDAPLTVADAAAFGGYSPSQLRRLLRDRTIPEAPNGGVRRRDIPIHPGHRIPLGLEPVAVAESDWTANLVQHRALGGKR